MALVLFLTFDHAPARLPALPGALVHTPDKARDPYLDDGAPPALVIQVYCPSVSQLESSVGKLKHLPCAAQAMEVREFAVPDPAIRAEPYCTYLVAYEGPAQDEKAWHSHYLAHHPPIMAKLPGIRRLEVYLPVDWRCPDGWRRETCMQRNKVAFDSPAALTAALDSPVRKEMRADYARLPAFSGRVTHFPMSTRVLSSDR